MGRKLPPQFEITIKEITSSGEGLGYFNDRPIYVFGVLPGEKVLLKPQKIRGKSAKATLLEVLEASPERQKEREEHFTSCSPWQVLPYEMQLELKKKFVLEKFVEVIGSEYEKKLEIEKSPEIWGYRNKMEFSFENNEKGELSLALHRRYKHNQYYYFTSCVLAHEELNKYADRIIQILRKNKVSTKNLKNLVIRYSYYENKCVAALYVKDENFKSVNDLNDLNLVVIYSNPKSPSTVITRILKKNGVDSLTEIINNSKLKFYFDSFFQGNIKAFEELMNYTSSHINSSKRLVDLYSGVGTIGFLLKEKFESILNIEIDKKATEAARKNAKENGIEYVEIFSGETEKYDIDKIILPEDTLTVDPPRTGLHPKVVKKILIAQPENFIYISCNPFTQIRDFDTIKSEYEIIDWRLFDLYPHTPHSESVMVLKKK